jgi:hypothetical protein
MSAPSRTPSFEFILQHFRSRCGLYLLGDGASAGLAPLGGKLYRIVALDWWHGGGFTADIPAVHLPLNRKIIESQSGCPQYEIWGREIRPGTEPFPAAEMLIRLPEYWTRARIKHELVRVRYEGRMTDSYRIFRIFHPAIILNYNHDGFAPSQCGPQHRVIDVHGAINPRYGSPEFEQFIRAVRDYDLRAPPDDLIMCERERERHDDPALNRRLTLAGSIMPDFIAIIGYSFAKVGDSYDDYVSLRWFKRRFHNFTGNVYVISPFPEEHRYVISDYIKSPRVFGVTAYWNILSHAFMFSIQYPGQDDSIYATHERLLSVWGDEVVFPRPLN